MPTKVEKDSVTGRETTGHQWDGLKELNTPLPKWWLYVLYACIAFALVWVVIYPAIPVSGATGLSGWTARGAIGPQLEAERAKQEPMLARLRAATPAQIAADPALRSYALAGGRIAFANNCAGCHGSGGQGAVGGFPSLATMTGSMAAGSRRSTAPLRMASATASMPMRAASPCRASWPTGC